MGRRRHQPIAPKLPALKAPNAAGPYGAARPATGTMKTSTAARFALERDAKKWAPVFRKNPALNIGIDHVYEFGLTQSKLIVI